MPIFRAAYVHTVRVVVVSIGARRALLTVLTEACCCPQTVGVWARRGLRAVGGPVTGVNIRDIGIDVVVTWFGFQAAAMVTLRVPSPWGVPPIVRASGGPGRRDIE